VLVWLVVRLIKSSVGVALQNYGGGTSPDGRFCLSGRGMDASLVRETCAVDWQSAPEASCFFCFREVSGLISSSCLSFALI
jgi:hypothetical protein